MAKRRRTAHRVSRRKVSYREDSSGSDSDDFEFEQDINDEPLEPPPKKIKPTTPTRPRAKATRSVVRNNQRPSRRFAAPRPAARSDRPTRTENIVVSDGKIPAWSSLPYEILCSIFHYASFPLQDGHGHPTSSLNWLLQAMRTCKAFAEPAITALYHTPPFASLSSPHMLRDALAADPAGLCYNYRAKVKRLEMTAYSLSHSAPGRGQFNIDSIVPLLPQLSDILIKDFIDSPPFRSLLRPAKFTYPADLFDALIENNIRLKSWRWNATLLDFPIETIKKVHSSAPFSTLQHLSISQAVFTNAKTGQLSAELLSDSLSGLPSLRGVSIESSHSDDWSVLRALPQGLTSLRIINCELIESRHVEPVLSSHGRYLKELVLNHNHSLDLGFLPTLGASCPDLQLLEMDLTYYGALSVTHGDASPQFDSLLRDDQIPTWPRSLQEVRLLQLRKWSATAAENFFASLVQSAADLPYLQVLLIKASLDIGWRDRATFRDGWVAKIRKVFLDRRPPPKPHLASFRAYRLWRERNNTALPNPTTKDDDQKSDKSRRSQRIKTMEDEEVARSKRSVSDLSDGDGSYDESLIQGQCKVLDVNIDNLRPKEFLWKEADFMDDEISGDEDWTGDREAGGTEYAW